MDLLDHLDAAQAEAVTCEDRPLAVIAAAGSGKTTVITRRIAHRVMTEQAEERHVVALTFSRQSAGELIRRLGSLGVRGVTAGTFHAVAYGLLRQRWADQGRPAPGLLTVKHGLVAEAIRNAGPGGTPGRRRPEVPDVIGELDWSRAQRIRPSQYPELAAAAGRRTSASPDAIVAAFDAFQKLKRTRRVVDFDDLLELCVYDMEHDADFAAQVRWRFRHFHVDEFQDVNPLQHALMESWRGGRDDLCVVGDPRQAIYGWNGAKPELLESIERTYPGIRIVRLRRNYRCSPAVVEAAAGALAAGSSVDDAVAVRPPSGSVELVGAPDSLREAALIADRLRRLRRPGSAWRSMAVLTRTNAQLEPILEHLTAIGIPAALAGRAATATDNPARRSLLSDARSTRTAEALSGWGRDLDDDTDGHDASPLHRSIATAVRNFLQSVPNGNGPAFVDWFELTGGGDDAPEHHWRRDAVDLLTFHAAKGREWRSVVVAGTESGLVPHSASTTAAAAAEEVRLLYVALTRASDDLVVTWAEQRNGRPAGRSPLLARVAERIEEPVRSFPAELRREPAPPPLVDPMLAVLRAWRGRAAAAANLPERAICDDAVLAAVAAARPASVEELAAVPGFGPLAARRIGPRLLAALTEADAV